MTTAAKQHHRSERSPEAQAHRHLKLLERRKAHLQQRIDALPDKTRNDGRVLSYDRSEILALEWAIGQLGRMWNYAASGGSSR